MATALLSSQVPTPMVPTTDYLIDDAVNNGALPPNCEYMAAGQSSTAPDRLNGMGTRVDLTARYGGGGNAICDGLTISLATGMVVNIAAGQAYINAGIVEVPAATTTTVSTYGAAHRVYLWLLADGSIYPVDNATTQPASQGVYLGSVLINGSNNGLTSFDDSGRLVLQNGIFEMTTADTGIPTAAPSSSVRYYILTVAGQRFWWTGSWWMRVMESGRFAKAMSTSNYTLVTPEYYARHLTFTGAIGAGRDVVLPLFNGAEWVVYNNTTGGFALTFKGSSGASVAVAATKTAIIRCDGTDILRVTADV